MTTDSRLQPAEIVGGQIAPSPIAWQVSVQFVGTHICGGTILDAYTILSAAHCFDDYGDSVEGFYVRAGSRKWSSGGQVCQLSHVSFKTTFQNKFPVLILVF